MINEKPLISIILPIYNVEKYLLLCMKTIISQSYKKLEIIMVDDGSLDSCGKLCEEYAKQDERIVVYHKENGGLSDARNYGIMRAKGEYIVFIDPDDYVDADYIEYLLKILQKYNSKISICQHRVCYPNGSVKENGKNGDEIIPTKKCLERMLYHDVIDTSAWGKLYHKSLFEKVLYPKGRIFEDIGTTYALMLQCDSIAVGYESKYNYIYHDNSIVNSQFNVKKLDLIDMTDKMAEDVKQEFPDLEKAVLRRQVYSRFSILNQLLSVECYDKQRKALLKFIRENRFQILIDAKAPKRDKLAILILSLNYNLYEFIWLKYRDNIMGK